MSKILLNALFTVIFTYFFAKLMTILFSDQYSGLKKREKVRYVISQEQGAVACITQNIYQKIQDYSKNNQTELISQEIKQGNCIILNHLDEVEALEDICLNTPKNTVKLFKTEKFILHELYLPCFAVEMKKILPKKPATPQVNSTQSN